MASSRAARDQKTYTTSQGLMQNRGTGDFARNSEMHHQPRIPYSDRSFEGMRKLDDSQGQKPAMLTRVSTVRFEGSTFCANPKSVHSPVTSPATDEIYRQNMECSFGENDSGAADPSMFSNEPQAESPTALNTSTKLPILDDQERQTKSPEPADPTNYRNVVIFGDSGVGKSSLINMLAGHRAAKTSSSVIGCTFQSSHFRININGELFNIWDTAGLDEGTRGRVPAEQAERNLTKLLRDLGGANGIHLLVYCVRGASVRKALTRNYTIFYSAICRKKVPIVVVVTGLENEPVEMDDWWTKGEKDFARFKMRFDDHACVTTLDSQKVAGTPLEARQQHSQEIVRNLISKHCGLIAKRKVDTNIMIKAALTDLRSMMKSGWDGQTQQHTLNVLICDVDSTVVMWQVMGNWTRCVSRINGRPFVFHRAETVPQIGQVALKTFKGGNADLLIFSGSMTNNNLEIFKQFHSSCGGEVCPLIIVTPETSTDPWSSRISALGYQAKVVSLPASGGREQVNAFHTLIDELSLVRGPAKFRKGSFFKFFKLKKDSKGDSPVGPLS
ncbi:hypothetical protein HYDPIDRAFT_25999 [Hydnomerulius pinastri MD-312]|nr:hypothetical protein HYDPIDRAFT_25999 [Hydnomerulius pinastri MD-312]